MEPIFVAAGTDASEMPFGETAFSPLPHPAILPHPPDSPLELHSAPLVSALLHRLSVDLLVKHYHQPQQLDHHTCTRTL